MAMANSFHFCFPLQRSCLVRRPVRNILRLQQGQVQAKKLSFPDQIKSPPKKKVFEDKSQGIICYRDDDGEIICEGYEDDEGPRCAPYSLKTAYQSRDAEILDLLQQSYLQLQDATRCDQEKIQAEGLTTVKWSEFNLF